MADGPKQEEQEAEEMVQESRSASVIFRRGGSRGRGPSRWISSGVASIASLLIMWRPLAGIRPAAYAANKRATRLVTAAGQGRHRKEQGLVGLRRTGVSGRTRHRRAWVPPRRAHRNRSQTTSRPEATAGPRRAFRHQAVHLRLSAHPHPPTRTSPSRRSALHLRSITHHPFLTGLRDIRTSGQRRTFGSSNALRSWSQRRHGWNWRWSPSWVELDRRSQQDRLTVCCRGSSASKTYPYTFTSRRTS